MSANENETNAATAIHVMHAINVRRRFQENSPGFDTVAGFSATVPMFFVAGIRALERETLAKLDALENELCR